MSSSPVVCTLPGCQRPCFVEPRTNIGHAFCGRTHALEAASLGIISRAPKAPHGRCHKCNFPDCQQPVHFDETTQRVHDFCSRSHADAAIQMGLWSRPLKSSVHGTGPAHPSMRCQLPGCSAPRYRDPNTSFLYDFCGRTHAKQAEEKHIIASSDPNTEVTWRGSRGQRDYRLCLLKASHPKYEGVRDQFLKAWRHPTRAPNVVRIIQIFASDEVHTAFNQYHDTVARACPDVPDIVVRRFHGTSMAPSCMFGFTNSGPCTDATCRVCGICCRGFDVTQAGVSAGQTMQLRYGPGMYFSKTSSKSNDPYAQGSERYVGATKPRRQRVMFLCKVVRGRALETRDANLPTQAVMTTMAHGGFHSVEGVPSAGGLNYDELVVYDSAAALPSYLIVYRFD